ncbi:MAG: hypothetical protein K2I46_01245 [Clostridia bacterium]|nr:hypothetical protein [Clostridia bacterium]MDE6472625.1 hypothetical protein [Clostridia bacterium]
MALVLILVGIFILLIGIFELKKFQLYALLTALACTVLSIELIADINGLTLYFLTALTLFSLPSISLKLFDIAGCLVITLPCIFWLSTQEFVDGFVYSLTLVALGVALACRLLFDRQKRQTLCALVLLTSFVVCYLSNIYFNAIDILLPFLVAIIFTQNYTRSIDLMTIDSYGTSL